MSLIPDRVYRIREHMFQIIPAPHQPPDTNVVRQVLQCNRCHQPCAGQPAAGWLSEDMAALVEACRQHEITEHSAVVSWEQFGSGYYIQPYPDVPLGATALVPERKRRAYEWLAEELTPYAGTVTVREPVSLAEWDGKYAPYMAEQAAGRAREAESLARGRTALDHQRATWFGEFGCR